MVDFLGSILAGDHEFMVASVLGCVIFLSPAVLSSADTSMDKVAGLLLLSFASWVRQRHQKRYGLNMVLSKKSIKIIDHEVQEQV